LFFLTTFFQGEYRLDSGIKIAFMLRMAQRRHDVALDMYSLYLNFQGFQEQVNIFQTQWIPQLAKLKEEVLLPEILMQHIHKTPFLFQSVMEKLTPLNHQLHHLKLKTETVTNENTAHLLESEAFAIHNQQTQQESLYNSPSPQASYSPDFTDKNEES
jgi:hypothetical protein